MHHYKDGVHDLKKKMKGGRWIHEEGVLHITYNIRTSGNMFCIKLFFFKKISSKHICFKTNHTTVVLYTNAMGSMQSKQLYNSW